MGNVLVGSALVCSWRWAQASPHCRYPFSLLSVLVVVRCCPWFVAVHRSLLSISILVCRALLNGFASLALRLAMGDVHGGVVALVGWACVQSWPVVCVGGFRGCSLSFAGRCVLCGSWLALLGGCGVVLGGCSCFWTLGTV